MEIIQATEADLDNVAEIMATEFFDDPVLKYAFTSSGADQRRKNLQGLFRVVGNLALTFGGVYLAENNVGALIFFKPELLEMTDEENAVIDNQLRQQCGDDFVTVAAFMHGLDRYHPRTPPHYYVFAIAVQRQRRGREIMTNLLTKFHNILDRESFPCYAECTSYSTRTLVRRFGYRDAGPPIHIDGFPDLFPIWREPQLR